MPIQIEPSANSGACSIHCWLKLALQDSTFCPEPSAPAWSAMYALRESDPPHNCPTPRRLKAQPFQRLNPGQRQKPISKSTCTTHKSLGQFKTLRLSVVTIHWPARPQRPQNTPQLTSRPLQNASRCDQPPKAPNTRSSTRTQPIPWRPGWAHTALAFLSLPSHFFLMGSRSDGLDGLRKYRT